MKSIREILSLTFLMCGAVMGAGFLSGRELVGFFGADNFLPFIIISGIVFFVGFSAVFLSKNEGSALIFGEKNHFFTSAVCISEFVLAVAMTAAMQEIFVAYGIGGKIPIISALALIFSYFYSNKGGKSTENLNLVLMPVALIIVNVIIFSGGTDFSLSNEADVKIKLMPVTKACLFACMNVFVSAPILIRSAGDKKRSSLILSALLFSVFAVVEGALILYKVKSVGNNAIFSDIPLLFSAKSGILSYLLTLALFIGTYTSAYACYAPLAEKSFTRFGKKGKIILTVLVYICSLIGLSVIIDYVYPVIGGFGGAYIVNAIIVTVKEKRKRAKRVSIKPFNNADNSLIPIKRKGEN